MCVSPTQPYQVLILFLTNATLLCDILRMTIKTELSRVWNAQVYLIPKINPPLLVFHICFVAHCITTYIHFILCILFTKSSGSVRSMSATRYGGKLATTPTSLVCTYIYIVHYRLFVVVMTS